MCSPVCRAISNTVGTSTTASPSMARLKVIPWFAGVRPVSMDVWEGSVLLGRMVCASSV